MKVYLVEKGCYSDRYVAGVFSSRELAEAYIAQHGPDDGWNNSGDVEEYELDKCASHVKRNVFHCVIDLESGEIFQDNHYEQVMDPHERGKVGDISDLRSHPSNTLGPHFGRISQTVTSYESADHARKLAAEARQAWLRAQLG